MIELSLVVTNANTKQLQNIVSNHTKNQLMVELSLIVTSTNTKQLQNQISKNTKNQFMMELSLVVTSANTKQLQNQISNHTKNQFMIELKGKLGDFFLFVQSFYWPKTKTSFNRQFSPKRPKLVKNQAKGSEIHQIRTKWHPPNFPFK